MPESQPRTVRVTKLSISAQCNKLDVYSRNHISSWAFETKTFSTTSALMGLTRGDRNSRSCVRSQETLRHVMNLGRYRSKPSKHIPNRILTKT